MQSHFTPPSSPPEAAAASQVSPPHRARSRPVAVSAHADHKHNLRAFRNQFAKPSEPKPPKARISPRKTWVMAKRQHDLQMKTAARDAAESEERNTKEKTGRALTFVHRDLLSRREKHEIIFDVKEWLYWPPPSATPNFLQHRLYRTNTTKHVEHEAADPRKKKARAIRVYKCDRCHGTIIAHRYSCTSHVCPDLNLCKTCRDVDLPLVERKWSEHCTLHAMRRIAIATIHDGYKDDDEDEDNYSKLFPPDTREDLQVGSIA